MSAPRKWVEETLNRQAETAEGDDERRCTHLDLIRDVTPSATGCEECLATGDTWLHLRMCLVCGHVGCCDQSKNKHAARHYHDTGHPLIQAIGDWEKWAWCYDDQVYLHRRGPDDE